MRNRQFLVRLLGLCCALLMLMPAQAAYAADAPAVASTEATQTTATTSMPPLSYTDHGQTLAEVIQGLRAEKYEFSCGFDQNGQKLFEVTNYLTTKVYTTSAIHKDFFARGGIVHAHNHPSGSAFSGQDLRAAATSGFPCSMVISDDYIYVIKPTTQGWGDPDAMAKYWAERYAYYHNYTEDFLKNYKINVKTILALPDTPDDGSFLWFCNFSAKEVLRQNPNGLISLNTGAWVSHHVLTDVAEKFQLEYHRYDTDEFDATDFTVFLPVTPENPTPETETNAETSAESIKVEPDQEVLMKVMRPLYLPMRILFPINYIALAA